MPQRLHFAIVGAGWAGLSAALQATKLGHRVTLFEMSAQLGGRARGIESNGMMLDNGQHIMIGAYTELLRLMDLVGADAPRLLMRTPLALLNAQGQGLRLPAGQPAGAFAKAVLRHSGWPWHARLALLAAAAGWVMTGFQCDPQISVTQLTARLPACVRHELIDPLCVAALNTPAEQASAMVFLRVLKDALFSGPGSADLLFPRVNLSELLPAPAEAWLTAKGADVRSSARVMVISRAAPAWCVDGEPFDRLIVATPAKEAARLTATVAPAWARQAEALQFEPIVTVYLRSPGTRLPFPMLALPAQQHGPAQFVVDRGQLGGAEGLLAFVISGAQAWVDKGADATVSATMSQARMTLGAMLGESLQPVRMLTEKRATFRCTPGLRRPAASIAPGMSAAGDYVDGPYPATLEGAARSGVLAVATTLQC